MCYSEKYVDKNVKTNYKFKTEHNRNSLKNITKNFVFSLVEYILVILINCCGVPEMLIIYLRNSLRLSIIY